MSWAARPPSPQASIASTSIRALPPLARSRRSQPSRGDPAIPPPYGPALPLLAPVHPPIRQRAIVPLGHALPGRRCSVLLDIGGFRSIMRTCVPIPPEGGSAHAPRTRLLRCPIPRASRRCRPLPCPVRRGARDRGERSHLHRCAARPESHERTQPRASPSGAQRRRARRCAKSMRTNPRSPRRWTCPHQSGTAAYPPPCYIGCRPGRTGAGAFSPRGHPCTCCRRAGSGPRRGAGGGHFR